MRYTYRLKEVYWLGTNSNSGKSQNNMCIYKIPFIYNLYVSMCSAQKALERYTSKLLIMGGGTRQRLQVRECMSVCVCVLSSYSWYVCIVWKFFYIVFFSFAVKVIATRNPTVKFIKTRCIVGKRKVHINISFHVLTSELQTLNLSYSLAPS